MLLIVACCKFLALLRIWRLDAGGSNLLHVSLARRASASLILVAPTFAKEGLSNFAPLPTGAAMMPNVSQSKI